MLYLERNYSKVPEKAKILQLKPITPKSLSMHSIVDFTRSPLALVTLSNPTKAIKILENRRVSTTAYNKHRSISPVPAFAKEYIKADSVTASKTKIKSIYATLKIKSKPVTGSSKRSKTKLIVPLSSQRRSNTLNQTQINNSEGNKIFRLYKPQTVHFSPRSKIQIFTTMDVGDPHTPKPLKKTINLLLNNSPKPRHLHPTQNEEVHHIPDKPIDYPKPAITFGEKLWRLNEVFNF